MKLAYSIHRGGTNPFHGKLLLAALCVWFAGFSVAATASPQLATPPVIVPAAAASAQVPVSQQPLTTRTPIPPNIVLMLDDSGSMAWNVMPDWSYLKSTSDDALIDSQNNGVYYNPAITYLPPPKADSTKADPDTYPNETDMTKVPYNGIAGGTTVNLFTYDGSHDSLGPCGSPGTPGCAGSSVPYNTGGVSHYRYPRDYDDGHWDHYLTSWPGKNYDFKTKTGCDNWYHDFDANRAYQPYYAVAEVYDPPSNPDRPDTAGCVIFWHTASGPYYFQYSTGPADGPYVVHYVAESDCSGSPDPANCVLASAMGAGGGTDPASTAAAQDAGAPAGVPVGQNIANWFAYYHTRILMARSGVMTAFVDVSPEYRVGFASIDGSGASWIQSNASNYFAFSTSTKSNNRLAEVAAFGDGSAGTQKAMFWDWIGNQVDAAGSTPLRGALKAVGSYYETDQPWASENAVTHETDYLACRQSYVILTTDGFWNGSTPSGIGNADENAGDKITGPNENSYTYEPIAPFTDAASNTANTLADVAMKYWMTDLKPTIPNEVPFVPGGIDPAFWQHMVTFTMGMGFTPSDAAGNPIDSATVQGLFDWASGGPALPSSTWGGWPKPSKNSINNIADLVHAGIDGHGGFFSATDPDSFVAGLKSALVRAKERLGTGASLAANSTKLDDGAVTYQASYHTSIWTGDLTASAISPAGAISAAPAWSAAAKMPPAVDRNIHTYVPGSGAWTRGSGTSVAFASSTASALSDAQEKALSSDGPAPATAASAETVAQMIDYLRGDESHEQAHGGAYRTRLNAKGTGENVLGDIVDSQPVYVGTPEASTFAGETFTGTSCSATPSCYATFVSDQSARAAQIYVAANDGMLHAFDASTGKETYAFLPADVITHGGVDGAGNIVGVSELANPDYGSVDAPHQFFNDGELTVANAYFDGAWHTVLVGTTGRGLAEAVYALDVTDPTNVKFLWERSAWDGGANSGYIGQMAGKPVIAQVANGQWVVLIGNGYNSANGVAALLQFDLSDGTLSVHTTTDTTTANGLAAPAVWIGDIANGVSTVAYAGDLHGQVWSFQLSQVTVSGGVTTITATPTSTGALLYTAKDSSGNAQPITAGMLTGRDPDTGNQWIFFGTGRYLSADDITDLQVQTWYGLIVQSSTPNLAVTSTSTRADLAERNIIAQTAGSSTTNPDGTTTVVLPARVVSPPDDPNTQSMAGKSGWYIDLETPGMDADGNATDYLNPVAEGERMVLPTQFHGSRLIGTTRIPTSSDVCNPSGTGWIMSVDPFTGTNPRPEFFDINGDRLINGGDMITVGGKTYAAAGVGFQSLPNSPTFVGNVAEVSFDNGTTSSIATSDEGNNFTRVSWREMVNP